MTASDSVVNSASITQYASSVSPFHTVITTTSVLNAANATQYTNSAPVSPVVTLSSTQLMLLIAFHCLLQYYHLSDVNPAVVAQYADSVPSSPVVTPISSVNPAFVTQHANSVPSSPVVMPTCNVNLAVVTQYVLSPPVVTPSTSVPSVIPSGPIPKIVNTEIITTSSSPEMQLPRSGILDSDQINFIRSGSCSL